MSPTTEPQQSIWHSILIRCSDTDEGSALAHALGATLIETIDEAHVRAFLPGDRATVDTFVSALPESMSAEQIEVIPERNWHESCTELWQPVKLGQITITPISTSEAARPRAKDELLIIPGTGFGTGHHPATAMLIELIQANQMLAPRRVLDLGCGSGILALVSRLVWPKAEIVAIDNDPLALENAIDIGAANNIRDITFACGVLDDTAGHFDVIIANLYSSLLTELSSALALKTERLFISGVMESEHQELVQAMAGAGWIVHNSRITEGWFSADLKRARVL